MDIQFKKATEKDIPTLVQLRIDYLFEDYGSLSEEQITQIKAVLPDYFRKHMNQDLFVYVAEEESIVACCFLLVTEKPANPAFIHGRTGTVLNVYTKEEYRRKGIARELLMQLISDAKEMGLDFVELKATEEGYYLYQSIGFEDVHSRYHNMKIVF